MTDLPNAPLSFRWYDALFNTARFQRYIANVADMEAHIHQLRAQAIKDNRELDKRAEQLDECRNRIAVLTGAATEQNSPYVVRGNHGVQNQRKQDRPLAAVRSTDDMACDSNRRHHHHAPGSNYAESPTVMHQQDNSALLAVAAVVLMSDDVQAAQEPEIPAQAVPCAPAYREPETPAYCAPEPQRESYTPPSRSESYESPSRNDSYDSPSSDNSGPSSD